LPHDEWPSIAIVIFFISYRLNEMLAMMEEDDT
jgi:hypothetical protein